MTLIVKKFGTYVSLGNLGLFLREIGFSLGNNHVLNKKKLKLPWGTS
jgi:hypothetical protein